MTLKKELRALKKKFGDDRRTRILTAADRNKEQQILDDIAAEESEEEFVLEFTRKGYLRRFSVKAYNRRKNKQQPLSKTLEEFDDLTIQTEVTNPTQEILALTRDGKAFSVRVSDIPIVSRQNKGVPLISLLPNAVDSPDDIIAQIVLSEERLAQQLILVTSKGKVKRLPTSELTNITGRGLTAVKLKEEDTLIYAFSADLGSDLILASSGGRLLRFRIDEEQLPEMSRTAQGPQGIRLPKSEHLVGCVPVRSKDTLLLISQKGYAKRILVSNFKTSNRGGIGSQSFKFSLKSDTLTSMTLAIPDANVTVLTDEGRCATKPVAKVALQGRSQPCDRLITPGRSETITEALVTLPVELEE